MDAQQLERDYEANLEKTTTVFNPLAEDFIVNWDGKPLKPAKRLKFTTYPYYEGLHLKKKLVEFIANKRGTKEIEEIEREVSDVKQS